MSESERFRLAAELFLEASALTRGEWASFLDARCVGDDELRREVEALLEASGDASVFRDLATRLRTVYGQLRKELVSGPGAMSWADEAAGLGLDAAGVRFPDERLGDVIGRYKLLEALGEGGFGRVWVAEQRQPVHRRVALKIIKIGMDTRQVVARFEQEQQALALMDHPHIAKVYDAGVTDSGRPYFVMELCKGDPVSVYCDNHRLDVKARLDVFRQVCSAVQHAHTKGVIHRDIKPGNVLASTQDGRAFVKVIDFGIAKAVDARLTEKTLFTQHRQLIGTPEYMSPEQAEGSLDIDTRTDVYSLGVLLYELLTGDPPFKGKDLRSAAYDEMRRIIREVDPPRPSLRLSRSSERLVSIAQQRSCEPSRLGTIVRGELDWIVMKALEKDRGRRYGSAGALGDDVGRYLAGAAVDAAPPSRLYLAGKFTRRHKPLVCATAAVAVTLLVGVVGFAWQANVAQRERDAAMSSQRAEAQERRAAEAVSDFVVAALASADPRLSEGDQGTTIVQAMEAAIADMDGGRFDDDPPLEVRIRTLIGMVLMSNAAYDRAGEQFRSALELRKAHLVGGPNDVIDLYIKLSDAADGAGRDTESGDWASRALALATSDAGLSDVAAGAAYSAAAAAEYSLGNFAEAVRLSGEGLSRLEHSDPPASAEQIAGALVAHGTILYYSGDRDNAIVHVSRALDMCNELNLSDRSLASDAADLLAALHADLQRFDDAIRLSQQALDIRREMFAGDHPDVARGLMNHGSHVRGSGRIAEAELLYLEGYEMMRRLFSDRHPSTLIAMNNLGSIQMAMGRPDQAVELYRVVLETRREIYGGDHPYVALSLNNYGNALLVVGRAVEGEAYLREAVGVAERIHGPDSSDLLVLHGNLAKVQLELGRVEEALASINKAIALAQGATPERSRGMAVALRIRASCLEALGRSEESLVDLTSSVAVSERVLGPLHPDTMIARRSLALALLAQGRVDEALAEAEALVSVARELSAPDGSVEIAMVLDALGACYAAAERYVESEAVYTEYLALRNRFDSRVHPDTVRAWMALVAVLLELVRPEEALGRASSAVATARELSPGGSALLVQALDVEVTCLVVMGQDAEALEKLKEALRVAVQVLPIDHPDILRLNERLDGIRTRLGQ